MGPRLVQTFGRRNNLLPLLANAPQFLGNPAQSLVTILTTLAQRATYFHYITFFVSLDDLQHCQKNHFYQLLSSEQYLNRSHCPEVLWNLPPIHSSVEIFISFTVRFEAWNFFCLPRELVLDSTTIMYKLTIFPSISNTRFNKTFSLFPLYVTIRLLMNVL